MKKKYLLVALVAIVLMGGILLWVQYQRFQQAITAPLHLPEQGLLYTLKSGTSIRALADELQNQGVIENGKYLEWLARSEGKAGAIRAGEYQLQGNITLQGLLEILVSGKTLQRKFAIVEGTRYTDMLAQLAELSQLEHTLDPVNFTADFQSWTSEPHPEGWFYCDTYFYQQGDTDKDILMRAYERLKQELSDAWEKRKADLPLNSPYEALILASIIEKETAVPAERSVIAGVFINRLRKAMKLQTDPTVIYGMGDKFNGNIRKADLKQDTPYNTYTRLGLPPTPIALVGREALIAATQPAETDALYFVAKGGGEHHFSKTYAEHRKAVINYQLSGNANRYKGDE